MKTEVCITIDTEFSVGGAFSRPDQYLPISEEVVNCTAGGRSQGLGFLLETFQRFGIAATFFVETLQVCYFGDAPMGRIVDRIAAAGHDVQLHLHPCWLQFRRDDWRSLASRPNDSCAGLGDDALDEMLGLGIAAFGRWGLPPPRTLRTGGFETDRSVYRAMTRARLPLASNISVGVHRPQDPSLHLTDGRHVIEDVLEVPALSYASPLSSGWRTLALTSTSSQEMQRLLRQAREAGISPVVILTHPFEFAKKRDFRYEEIRRNRVNQHRLEQLLSFLHANSSEFAVTTFGARGAAWREMGPSPAKGLRVSVGMAVARTAQNAINDLVWAY